MSTNRTIPQRIGDWKTVYDALAAEAEDPALSALMALAMPNPDLSPEGNAILVSQGVQAARVVHANRRAAMIAAAMLTQSGVSRPSVGEALSEDVGE